MEDKIYVFGHKNPDTDSVCAAISLSYLQNQLGLNTEPRVLSNINEETRYVLKRLKVDVPEILDDVKLKISDINYRKGFKISANDSVYHAFFKMMDENMSTIPIVDDSQHFLGVFAMKDIAKKEILEDVSELHTLYDYILDVLNGTEVLRFDNEINGQITNISLRSTTYYNSNLLDKDTILIVGDRHSIIEDAINKKIKLLIITYNNEIKPEHLEIARKNKVNIIYTKMTSFETLEKIGFASIIKKYRYTENIVCVNERMTVTELNEIINKTKHSYYPVVDSNNICKGLIKLADIRDNNPKKVMLVDHNQSSQSVDGLEEAQVLSIIDHHNLGNLGTSIPINFRNMTVGSTCTILYHLFKEYKVKIPEQIGALLMAGLVSDTLFLKSPTTTKDDEKVLNELVKLTKIDAEKFAIDMFKANDATKSKTIKEIVYTDFKTYSVDDRVIAISQITTLHSKAILKQKSSYIRFLNKESEDKEYDILVLAITDIFKNGSYILFNTNAKNTIKRSYGEDIEQGSFLPDYVSRKKQFLPKIMDTIS